MSFIFSEQHQILNQFLQSFNEIINTKIEYKTLSDTEQDIFSHMVSKDSLLIVCIPYGLLVFLQLFITLTV